MEKTYYTGKSNSTGGFNFVTNIEKVSEDIFNELISAKVKELLGEEQKHQHDECLKEIKEALLQKKPVTILDRNFEIKIKKITKS